MFRQTSLLPLILSIAAVFFLPRPANAGFYLTKKADCKLCIYSHECISGLCYRGKCVAKTSNPAASKCRAECSFCTRFYHCATSFCYKNKCAFRMTMVRERCFNKKSATAEEKTTMAATTTSTSTTSKKMSSATTKATTTMPMKTTTMMKKTMTKMPLTTTDMMKSTMKATTTMPRMNYQYRTRATSTTNGCNGHSTMATTMKPPTMQTTMMKKHMYTHSSTRTRASTTTAKQTTKAAMTAKTAYKSKTMPTRGGKKYSHEHMRRQRKRSTSKWAGKRVWKRRSECARCMWSWQCQSRRCNFRMCTDGTWKGKMRCGFMRFRKVRWTWRK